MSSKCHQKLDEAIRGMAIIAVVIMVIGCANPAILRTRVPMLELKSNKPALSVAMCITDRWENLGIFGSTIPVDMRPIPNGYTIRYGEASMLVDVIDTEQGSQTLYYKSNLFGAKLFKKAVIECQ